MNKVIVTLLVMALVFIAVVIVCNVKGVLVQEGVVTGFFSMVTAELGFMGGIKIFKRRGRMTGDGEEEERG
jgi:hypothetical protein